VHFYRDATTVVINGDSAVLYVNIDFETIHGGIVYLRSVLVQRNEPKNEENLVISGIHEDFIHNLEETWDVLDIA
jgi:hypothetical protein